MNHLPFVLRTYLDVPWTPATTRRTQVKMPALRFGGDNGRMILQDLCVDPLYTFQDPGGDQTYPFATGMCTLLARLGWEGKGYLTEELFPLALQTNSTRPLVPVWKFARPYRLDPGQKMQARIIHRGATAAYNGINGVPGLMFHGERIKDGLPVMLYDSYDAYITPPANDYGQVVNLSKSTYNCPSDSSILIHSVAYNRQWTGDELGGVDPAPLVQIYDPNGRPWSTSEVVTNNLFLGVAPAAANNYSVGDWADGRGWLDPPQNLIALGEDRGWVLRQNETLLLELENPDNAQGQYTSYNGGVADGYDLMVAVTLRGCLEVPNG